MLYLDKIVTEINDNYCNKLAVDSAFGITQPIKRQTQTFPGYLMNGEFKYIGPDDNYKLAIYHKQQSNNYSDAFNIGRESYEKCVSQMSLVIFGLRKNMTENELEQKFAANLIDKISKENLSALSLKSVKISKVSSVINPEIVFSNEFKGVDYKISEKHILIQLNYNIEAVYNAACFTNC